MLEWREDVNEWLFAYSSFVTWFAQMERDGMWAVFAFVN